MRFFALALFLFAAAPAAGDDLSRFAGKYIGCTVSSGEWVPIATTLTDRGGSLEGDYVFIESPGRWIPGKLAYVSRDGEMRFAFTWSDIYGAGPAAFAFSADGARFDGFWTGGSTERYPWNGVRQGSGLPAPDCTVPVS